MKGSYHDILSRIDDEPVWWDRHGAPRWSEPKPENGSYVYADTVVFMKILCQGCGEEYLVELAFAQLDRIAADGRSFVEIDPTELSYGDPPNTTCCSGGATMSSIPKEVVAAYRRDGSNWLKTHENVAIEDDTVPLSGREEWF